MTKEKLAKIIRIITIPPIMVLSLLIILLFYKGTIFKSVQEAVLSVLFLAVIPALAYPLASVLPRYKEKGRNGQRVLAFIMSLVGYITAVVYGFAAHVSQSLMFIYLTYFISVFVLTIFNKIIKLRASGHACSITGPLILMVYFIGWKCVLPCAALFALIIWSSLALKRHTPKDLAVGSGAAAIAFILTLLFISLY